MLCSTAPAGTNQMCLNDFGGPVVAFNRLVGVTSWIIDCTNASWPAVHTRISTISVRSFIRRTTGL